jgi:hypothetical protein
MGPSRESRLVLVRTLKISAAVVVLLMVATSCGTPPKPATESTLRVVDPNGAGAIQCIPQRDDLTRTGFLICTARDMTIELEGRPLAVWRIPITRRGEPCCAADLPCCGPQQPGCPCNLFQLMEAKHAYPSSCSLEGTQWRCIVEGVDISEQITPKEGLYASACAQRAESRHATAIATVNLPVSGQEDGDPLPGHARSRRF